MQFLLTSFTGHHPGTVAPGGMVAHVLAVPACKVRHPVAMVVLVKTDDYLFHASPPEPCAASGPAEPPWGEMRATRPAQHTVPWSMCSIRNRRPLPRHAIRLLSTACIRCRGAMFAAGNGHNMNRKMPVPGFARAMPTESRDAMTMPS